MLALRDYQIKAVEAGLNHLRNGRTKDKATIIAPTGSGKSLIVAKMAQELENEVLVLQPSKELLEQNFAKYTAYGGEASLYSASVKSKEIGKVTFATIGSIKTKADLFKHVRYIIIDENHLVPPKHKSMYMSFLKELSLYTNFMVVGLTATPFRLKTYMSPFTGDTFSQLNLLPRERPSFFNKIIHVTQIKELVDTGYLATITYIPLVWDDTKLVVNTTGAEFDDRSVDRELERQQVHQRIPLVVKQARDKGRKFQLVFVKNVDDAEDLAMKVPDSACVSAMTKKNERERIIKDFKSGKIKTIFNVGVLTVGFDFPPLDTIIIARPTKSLALYMQMVGRGIRPSEGKKNCALVDMVGNIDRFSKIEEIRFEEVEGKWEMRAGDKLLSGVPIE